MANFKTDILEAVGDEPIEAIMVLRQLDYWDTGFFPQDPREKFSKEELNIPLPPEVALPKLDYEYDDGYGSQDCHEILIWTESSVFYIHEYDGATSIYSVKRNPS